MWDAAGSSQHVRRPPNQLIEEEERFYASSLGIPLANSSTAVGILDNMARPARARCRSGISRGDDERQLALTDGLRGVANGLANVLDLEIRVGRENLRIAHALGDHADHGRDRDP